MATSTSDTTATRDGEPLHYDTNDLPRKIQGMHDGPSDPWWKYKGEHLFPECPERVHDRVAELANSDIDVGRYSPRNQFRKTTKIRTKDQDAFDEALAEQIEEVEEDFEFLMLNKLQEAVDVHQKGERRTDVRFSPSFGRPAGLGGKPYYREKVTIEILRFEVEVFWKRVLEPVFEEFNEKYPY
jgi:hypothetical protein